MVPDKSEKIDPVADFTITIRFRDGQIKTNTFRATSSIMSSALQDARPYGYFLIEDSFGNSWFVNCNEIVEMGVTVAEVSEP